MVQCGLWQETTPVSLSTQIRDPAYYYGSPNPCTMQGLDPGLCKAAIPIPCVYCYIMVTWRNRCFHWPETESQIEQQHTTLDEHKFLQKKLDNPLYKTHVLGSLHDICSAETKTTETHWYLVGWENPIILLGDLWVTHRKWKNSCFRVFFEQTKEIYVFFDISWSNVKKIICWYLFELKQIVQLLVNICLGEKGRALSLNLSGQKKYANTWWCLF